MSNFLMVLVSIAVTAISWGVYGPLMREGQEGMGGSHLLPFICVGLAYFVIAVVAAGALLKLRGESGQWSTTGIVWSFAAGVVTAVGALGVILAFTNHGSPIYVMPLIFGCAPVVNTFMSMYLSRTYREAGPMFYAGLILVIAGAVSVLFFNPAARSAQPISVGDLMKVIIFVAMTAICWGMYGPLLHKGQMAMQGSRLRPYICVGVAYFLIAVLAPLILRMIVDDHGYWSWRGVVWSGGCGVAGAIGALGVIMAFTFGGKPVYVMPLIFGAAPVINTLLSIKMAKSVEAINPLFYAALIVVVAGATAVLIFAPKAHAPAAKKRK